MAGMAFLERLLAKVGYVKLSRYGLTLTPQDTVLSLQPPVNDEGNSARIVGWREDSAPGMAFTAESQIVQLPQGGPVPRRPGSPPPLPAKRALAAGTAPPPVGVAARGAGSVGAGSVGADAADDVADDEAEWGAALARARQIAEAAAAAHSSSAFSASSVANASERGAECAGEEDADEEEWEWQLALARAKAAAEEAELHAPRASMPSRAAVAARVSPNAPSAATAAKVAPSVAALKDIAPKPAGAPVIGVLGPAAPRAAKAPAPPTRRPGATTWTPPVPPSRQPAASKEPTLAPLRQSAVSKEPTLAPLPQPEPARPPQRQPGVSKPVQATKVVIPEGRARGVKAATNEPVVGASTLAVSRAPVPPAIIPRKVDVRPATSLPPEAPRRVARGTGPVEREDGTETAVSAALATEVGELTEVDRLPAPPTSPRPSPLPRLTARR